MDYVATNPTPTISAEDALRTRVFTLTLKFELCILSILWTGDFKKVHFNIEAFHFIDFNPINVALTPYPAISA